MGSPELITGMSSTANLRNQNFFLEIPNACAIDEILFRLALNAMHLAGHRYGAFLDAAMTAAKCAIYTTYLEEGRSYRKTGLLHHVDPKRVKVIIQEVQSALHDGRLLKTLASQEPQYLICLPHIWQKLYPWQPGRSRFPAGLSLKEQQRIEADLPPDLPNTLILNSFKFEELITLLHAEAEQELPKDSRTIISEPLIEHIKLRLLHSGTVIQMDNLKGMPLFVLADTAYSPKDKSERGYTMLEDVASFFQLMQFWVEQDPNVLRGLETFCVRPERKQEALQELDKLVQAWADKYHEEEEEGESMVMHFATGPQKIATSAFPAA